MAVTMCDSIPGTGKSGAVTEGPARTLAHVVIGYFGMGMMAFGASAAARAHFPVPGGAAWEGPIAVVGGLAALVIGSATLVEHCVTVRATRQADQLARVTAR